MGLVLSGGGENGMTHIGIIRALEVNNIFNQQYEVVRSYPMPGTNFKFILNLTI